MLYDKKWDKPLVVADPASDLLRKAADKIERCGWCQGTAQTYYGSFCALGALEHAQHAAGLHISVYFEAVSRLIDLLRLTQPASIATWNDTKGRTKEQVVSAMRDAAAGIW